MKDQNAVQPVASERRLEDVANVRYGTRVVKKRDAGSTYPVYGGGGATFSVDDFNRENCYIVSRFGMSEECVRRVSGRFFLNDSGLTVDTADENLLFQRFLDFFLLSSQAEIYGLGRGTAQKNLNVEAFKSLLVPLPPLEEQKRVVAVLDQAFAALDRARAHVEASLADAEELFGNSLLAIFNELIPSSDMMTLSEAAEDFSRGKSRHRPRNDPKLYGGDYPFIQTGDIRRSNGSIRDYSQTYNSDGLAQSKLWPSGTVCITIAANIAETGVLEFDSCFPDSVIGMVPNPNISNAYYVEYMLRYFAKELKLQGKGSAQDNINLATFEKARFPVPSLTKQAEVIEKLDSVAAEVVALKANYASTLDDIADLRQSLLQKAFSGQLTA